MKSYILESSLPLKNPRGRCAEVSVHSNCVFWVKMVEVERRLYSPLDMIQPSVSTERMGKGTATGSQETSRKLFLNNGKLSLSSLVLYMMNCVLHNLLQMEPSTAEYLIKHYSVLGAWLCWAWLQLSYFEAGVNLQRSSCSPKLGCCSPTLEARAGCFWGGRC